MPWLDVTDVLLDPMIAGETIAITRRQETIGSNGRSSVTTTNLTAVASVVPTGSNSLVRAEAYQSKGKSIKVITSTRLYGPEHDPSGNNYQPDVITWKGDSFVVKMVNDYTKYGAGLCEAECASIDTVDQAPY